MEFKRAKINNMKLKQDNVHQMTDKIFKHITLQSPKKYDKNMKIM